MLWILPLLGAAAGGLSASSKGKNPIMGALKGGALGVGGMGLASLLAPAAAGASAAAGSAGGALTGGTAAAGGASAGAGAMGATAAEGVGAGAGAAQSSGALGNALASLSTKGTLANDIGKGALVSGMMSGAQSAAAPNITTPVDPKFNQQPPQLYWGQ